MDEDQWYANAFNAVRRFRDEEDRKKNFIEYISSKSDLIKAADVTSVLAIGPGNHVTWLTEYYRHVHSLITRLNYM